MKNKISFLILLISFQKMIFVSSVQAAPSQSSILGKLDQSITQLNQNTDLLKGLALKPKGASAATMGADFEQQKKKLAQDLKSAQDALRQKKLELAEIT